MSPAKRHTLGIILILAPIVAAIAIQLWGGSLVSVGETHVSEGGSGHLHWIAGTTYFELDGRYVLALLGCAGAGLVFLLWPARKPPVLRT